MRAVRRRLGVRLGAVGVRAAAAARPPSRSRRADRRRAASGSCAAWPPGAAPRRPEGVGAAGPALRSRPSRPQLSSCGGGAAVRRPSRQNPTILAERRDRSDPWALLPAAAAGSTPRATRTEASGCKGTSSIWQSQAGNLRRERCFVDRFRLLAYLNIGTNAPDELLQPALHARLQSQP